jgi:hypothetical protein
MPLRLRQWWTCAHGVHRGRNFCADCGQQLVAHPFVPFRVRSPDGQLDVTLRALNAYHAKRRAGSRYCLADLIVERLPDSD